MLEIIACVVLWFSMCAARILVWKKKVVSFGRTGQIISLRNTYNNFFIQTKKDFWTSFQCKIIFRGKIFIYIYFFFASESNFTSYVLMLLMKRKLKRKKKNVVSKTCKYWSAFPRLYGFQCQTSRRWFPVISDFL